MTEGTPIKFSRLRVEDAVALCSFYCGLSEESIRTFRPIGIKTTVDVCRSIAEDNSSERDLKFDVVAWQEGVIVGWCFLWNLDSSDPLFGLAVADICQGQGIGTALACHVISVAARRGIGRVILTVIKDNQRARVIYERLSFSVYGEYVDKADGLTYLKMAAEVQRNESVQPEGSVDAVQRD